MKLKVDLVSCYKIVHSLSVLVSFLLIAVMTNGFDVTKSVIGTGTLSKTVSLRKNMNVLKHVNFVFCFQ